MSDAHSHDISKHVKIYILVFVALLVGTIVTVGLNAIHFDNKATTITIALFVALVKAFLVAGFFMHLISERKAIYSVLLATVFFFAAMMYLLVWSRDQLPAGSIYYGHHDHGPTEAMPAAH